MHLLKIALVVFYLDIIELINKLYKGKKDKIKEHADAHGESTNAFINRAIDETIERDKAK